MSAQERRYDIDWLRVIAIGLLLIYHIGIAYQPWGVFIGVIQSEKPLGSLWAPMSLLNVWRIPLLFYISGMGVCFALKKRNLKQLLVERGRRILIPFLFGLVFVVPIHICIWQKYYNQDLTYSLHPSHLWFLAFIFIYVVLFTPLFFYLKRHENGWLNRGITRLFNTPGGLLVILSTFTIETLLVNPETFETYSMTWHGFFLGLLAFFFGYCSILAGKGFWTIVLRFRWIFLFLSVILFLIRFRVFGLMAPNYLKAIESNLWIFTLFGFGYKYMNRPSRILSYLSQGAYPIYIIHMAVLYAVSYLIIPLSIPTGLEFILVVMLTFIGCITVYDLIIKRVRLLRPLFGLTTNYKKIQINQIINVMKTSKTMKVNRISSFKKSMFAIIIFSILFAGCDLFDTQAQYTYQPPEKIEDGIDAGTCEEVNMDVSAIEDVVNEIRRGRYSGVHAMLIFKDNKLVVEEYFEGHVWQWDAPSHHGELVDWDMTMPHNIHSSAKSITSACIGIAIDQGFIESVNQSIFEYLPDHQDLRGSGKERITIEHLLTMTAGLEWREWSAPYSSPENPIIGIWFQDKDPVSFILGMPLVSDPGTSYNYSTGNMVLLGEILRNATGMTIEDFSYEYLFAPLGIDSAFWPSQYENGVDANVLYLTPRGMIKIGATFLNNGTWNGNRIVSEEWVEKSAFDYPGNHGINVPGEASGREGYSYSWWTKDYTESGKEIHMYSASGFGGQQIMVFPDLNTVVVFTGGNYLTKRPPHKIIKKYVIPSLF